MTIPLQVKVSRGGKEIGAYEAKEAVRLLLLGILTKTDFYWHEGMTEWAPLLELEASKTFREIAEKAKEEEAANAKWKAKAKEEEAANAKWKAKAKEEEAEEEAISAAARVLRIKKLARDRLDSGGIIVDGLFRFLGLITFVIGGAVLWNALTGYNLRNPLEMTNGILLMILGRMMGGQKDSF
jgi:hypothetical protein